MKPSIYVVILNWNQPKLTLDCLESLNELRIKNYELRVVIVDNGSTDSSVEILEKYVNNNQNCLLLTANTNLGFAGGNNVGIKYALKNRADYVCILNNDTLIDKNIFNQFLIAAEKHPEVGVFTPKIYFAKGYEFHKDRYQKAELGKVIWSAGGNIDWKNVYGTNRGVDEVDHGQFDKLSETGFATGACMFVKSEVFRKVGLFNEKYFLYLEDLEFSQRAKKKKWKILYVPKAVIWHKVSQSSVIGGQLNDYYTTRNRLIFGMKYAPIRTRIALIKESIKMLLSGRKWQKAGVADFYLQNFYKGSWN